MSANQRAVMPPTEPVERTRVFQDEWAIRYGVLMGGTSVVETPGIGQFWIGHSRILRRQLMGFTRQQVRGRNEDESVLDAPGGSLLGPGPLDSEKLVDKSPALCMREAIQMLGAKGFVNSQTLMGDKAHADRLFNVVLPGEIAVLPIVDVIDFMAKSEYVEKAFNMDAGLRGRAQTLREELLQGAYIARAYMENYTSAISEEISQFADKKTGKRGVDSVDIEYFWELKKTLPKDRPLEATTLLGKEIAGALSQKGGDSSEVLTALLESNRLQADQNTMLRARLDLIEAANNATAETSTEKISVKRPKAN